ncbi:UNVERIFIED_CONTAM: Chitin-inducible gibberellin-responsive protein 1 [Sesamum latifolium]|uniref:Chitin-inducible gibberellin-responsive protein 1 n=1 Tax=Sesamum latifolium TaxID=2727402 RepID=A0AAW2TPT9_9LAMI
MDSHYLGYEVAGAGLAYSSYTSASSTPPGLFRPSKLDSRNLPRSPFFTPYDTETLTTYGVSWDPYGLAYNPSGPTLYSNSLLDYNNCLQQPAPSPFCLQDSSLISSNDPSFRQNVNDNHQIRQALWELESALMDADDDSRPSSWDDEQHIEKRCRAMEDFAMMPVIPSDNLKHLLISCARALSEDKLNEFEERVKHARNAVSISGEPIQRLGAYMLEGLIARKELSGTNIYHALKCSELDSKDLLSYMRILYEICPYYKFGYMAANGAIAEACKNEDRIHIIDFQIAQGTQWITLLQALAARPGGAPRVRITGIDDPFSEYARGDGLAAVGKQFEAISKKYNIPVEFHAVPVFALDVTRNMLDVRPGEALAVNFPLQLHHTPDESVDVSNPRDGLLRMVKSLSPKVVTLVEQESNTNTAAFLARFTETLDYYLAMFESIDVTMPRDGKERINVEQQCLAREIVNVVACEGKARVERHELFGKWRLRFMMAGFRQLPLSSYVNSVIRGLLRCYSEHYTLVEKDGGMLLGWKDRNLISASAWH